MNEPPFPARLHVLVAKDNKTAVVIRRGPSKHTCVLSWDIAAGDISVSQWMHGRIYERRSDISPDGKYWIYFAMNGKWDSEVKGSWTAIARVPWLKAIVLYPKGDCWNGGGLFTGDRTYWLNDGYGHAQAASSTEVDRVPEFDGLGYYGGECPSVYYNRLQRDGWTLVRREQRNKLDAFAIFEKRLPQDWTFQKTCHEQIGAPKGKGCYWDEHALISDAGNRFEFPDWEWAEWLGDHIAFAKDGCLFRTAIVSKNEISNGSLIHDFNHYTFEPLEAPY